MNKYTNQFGKECYEGVEPNTRFDQFEFHMVEDGYDDDIQMVLHTNLGSLTVVDRMTGFGWRDIETGYRSKDGKFWLASGGCDVMDSDCETIQDAIDWVKERANTCLGE